MDTLTHIEQLPTSFGALKPVGHVLVALATRPQQDIVRTALLEDGWSPDAVAEFSPLNSVEELTAMTENASGMAGFGYELTLMRRYLELARSDHRWLLVKADDEEHAQRIGHLARLYGASAAVHYRLLTVEELL